MAKTNAQYKAEQYARKKEAAAKLGIVARVLPVPQSIWSMLQELCEWHAFTDWRELVLNMIRVCHAAGPAGHTLVEIPKSGFVPTERQLQAVGVEPVCETCGGAGFVRVCGLGGETWTEQCLECEGV